VQLVQGGQNVSILKAAETSEVRLNRNKTYLITFYNAAGEKVKEVEAEPRVTWYLGNIIVWPGLIIDAIGPGLTQFDVKIMQETK